MPQNPLTNKPNTFTPENCVSLQQTCRKIDSLLKENNDGNLMVVQLICLGEFIAEFAENPIVSNSGIIKKAS